MLPAEEREVGEERVEMRVQAQREGLSVVRPVYVGQSPEKQQEHFLDEEDEARRECRTWGKREQKCLNKK